MKYQYLFNQITSFKNLLSAFNKAMRSKKKQIDATRFYFHLETELLVLEKDLLNETYEPQSYHHFQVFEPKKRDICAAPIRDCIVHHAICNIIETLLDKTFIKDSYACRKNKGVYAAVYRAQEFSRKLQYVSDASTIFQSIKAFFYWNMTKRLEPGETWRLLEQ